MTVGTFSLRFRGVYVFVSSYFHLRPSFQIGDTDTV